MKSKNKFRAGIYLLETLTSGMYNNPLSVYREYIQNSVDSIDKCEVKKNKSVNIIIDPRNNYIKIIDNAVGLPSQDANRTLSGIGTSDKNNGDRLRGFRGIGRLSGIAFSNKVQFSTKYEGENIVTNQAWDCTKLRTYIDNRSNSYMTLEELFNDVTTFNQMHTENTDNSYFKVTLDGVTSFRNYITDLRRVRDYITKVAPIDYDPTKFGFHKKLNHFLLSNVSNYGTYKIYVNNKRIYKPYCDTVKITKGGYDSIIGIELVKIYIGSEIAAFGWYGKRSEFIGSIIKGDNSSGLTVRVGNILLGDSHLLDFCFREDRFNSYIIGELHVVHPHLIPNSRRDDFVDNDAKTKFYNEVSKVVGIPISKEIRLRSRIKSMQSTSANTSQQSTNIPSSTIAYLKVDGDRDVRVVDRAKKENVIGHVSSTTILKRFINSCSNCDCMNKVVRQLVRESQYIKKPHA